MSRPLRVYAAALLVVGACAHDLGDAQQRRSGELPGDAGELGDAALPDGNAQLGRSTNPVGVDAGGSTGGGGGLTGGARQFQPGLEDSCGNGAAMRIAPLGAYFADDPKTVTEQAIRASEVTHQHPEGIAGGVAVAHAAALAARARLSGSPPRDLLGSVLDHLEDSFVRKGIEKARKIENAEEAAYVLGNGSRVTAQDTVPFTLWVAAHHLDDYRAAITACVKAGGDVDTTAAIVGGIIATPPPEWRREREELPGWVRRLG